MQLESDVSRFDQGAYSMMCWEDFGYPKEISSSHHDMTNDLAFFAANRLEAVPADTKVADTLVGASLQT